MKTTKKLVLVMIVLLSTILITTIGAFSWIYLETQKDISELITKIDSTRIFEASMKATLDDKEIKYSDSELYDTKSYMYTFDDVNQLKNDFKLYVTIDAKKRIKVRFKTVLEWVDKNGTIVKDPSYVTFNHSDQIVIKENDPYFYYQDSILKDKKKENLLVIDSANVLTKDKESYTLNFTIIVEAVQYNYENSWDAYPTQAVANQIMVNEKTKVTVKFNNVFQVGILRGILIEFVKGDEVYRFVYGENREKNELTLEKGTYDAYVYTHKLFQSKVKLVGSELIVEITYKPVDKYEGIHGFIFGPNIISMFEKYTSYSKGTIVYTIEEGGRREYWTAKIDVDANNGHEPKESKWAWEIMGKRWNHGSVVSSGKVVFYDGTFWQSTNTIDNYSVPGSDNQGWKRLDNQWFLNNIYKIGDIVLYKDTYWMSLTDDGNYTNPGNNANYNKFASLGYKYIKTTRSTYAKNDIVLSDGIYYKSTGNSWRDPSVYEDNGNDGWIALGYQWDYEKSYQKNDIVKYGEKTYQLTVDNSNGNRPDTSSYWIEVAFSNQDIWSSNKTYQVGDYVTYNDESYVLKSNYNNIKGNSYTPSQSVVWRKLTDEFNPYNNYKQLDRYSLVYYNNAWWKWNYINESDSVKSKFNGINPLPGEIYDGISYFQEITIEWKDYNRYKQGDMVIFGGYFYKAKVDINDFRHVGDIQFWERYDIDWNPNT